MHKFLVENDYKNVVVVNRSQERGEALASQFGSDFLLLDELPFYTEGLDALISCTASDSVVIGPELFRSMTNNLTHSITVIDLALPADIHTEIAELRTHHSYTC